MFHETFELHGGDDDPAAEYLDDETILKYYMNHIYSSIDFCNTNEHEWIHGLIAWATDETTEPDRDHFIIRLINY